MPYLVTCEAGSSVTVPKAVGEMKDDEGVTRFYDTEGVLYMRGDIIADADVSPTVRELYDGDPEAPAVAHLHSVLRKLTPAQAKKLAAKPNAGLDDDIAVPVPADDDPLAEQVVARPKGEMAATRE
jgi:hypothetical protein